jgi:hypothetical protein
MTNISFHIIFIKKSKQISNKFLIENDLYYNKCSIELFIKLAMTVFFKRQQHRKLSWLDKDSDKNQSQFDELFN